MKEISYKCPKCNVELKLVNNVFFHLVYSNNPVFTLCGLDLLSDGLRYHDVVCEICLSNLIVPYLSIKICSNINCQSYQVKSCMKTESFECSKCNRKLVKLDYMYLNFQNYCIFPIRNAQKKDDIIKAINEYPILEALKEKYG